MAIQSMVPISPRPCHGEWHCLAPAGRVISRPDRPSLSFPIESDSSSSQAHPWIATSSRDPGGASGARWSLQRALSTDRGGGREVMGFGRPGAFRRAVRRPGLELGSGWDRDDEGREKTVEAVLCRRGCNGCGFIETREWGRRGSPWAGPGVKPSDNEGLPDLRWWIHSERWRV